ncbi:DUF1835 domain-containing protein [Kiloniella sp. EL199]|uniref:DUF1835 domain-containing protein n=1 Tax=Kiloniella sp. EL199 TaxID=2107581 RepID=UPI001C1FB45D|nr:DUF1835 domain-containing protein [Kiloniella sp. EL199]
MSTTPETDLAFPASPRTMFHGALDYEQQKKRAKELLKAFRNQDHDAREKLLRFHPQYTKKTIKSDDITLADCQLCIARQNDFSSWSKLKMHCDQLKIRQNQIKSGRIPELDNANTLHVRCGSDIRHGLKVAGFKGDFHEFSDPFCQGPVPEVNKEEFLKIRADFISTAYGLPLNEVTANQKISYEKLYNLSDYDQVVLWFEHDSYDQLILAFLLNHLSSLVSHPKLEIICIDRVPGVSDFIGLGQLAPEMLIWLWENRRSSITDQQLSLGKKIWKAIQQKTPDDLKNIIHEGVPELPFIAQALARHLKELPSDNGGLGLTQHLTLRILNDKGPLKGKDLFAVLMQEYEPLPYLGDLMYWHELVNLAKTNVIEYEQTSPRKPWPERKINITTLGQHVFSGKISLADLSPAQRWVGGIKVYET